MNPKVSIAIDVKNKAVATVSGMLTVGADVDVELNGLPGGIPDWGARDAWRGPSVRLRIVDERGHDLVRYPMKDGDGWDSSFRTNDGHPVDMDTDRLRCAFHGVQFNEAMEFGLIVDSVVDKAQYAVGKIKVRQWSVASTEDPAVLPDWRGTLDKLNEDLSKVEDSKNSAREFAGQAEAGASSADASARSASDSAVAAKNHENRALVAAQRAENAKVFADQAKASAENAEAFASHYPYVSESGHWIVWENGAWVDKGPTQGESGYSPRVGNNGNWFVGDVDTGVKARGDKGDPGTTDWSGIKGVPDQLKNIGTELSKKQDSLKSGVNVKTINGESILGSGNIKVGGGGGGGGDPSDYAETKENASKGASHAAIQDGSNPHGTTAGEIPYKDWSAGEALAQLETDIAEKRSDNDNVCYEDSYEWVFGGGAEGMSGVSVEFFPSSEGSESGDWLISVGGIVSGSCSGKKNDTHLDFESYNPEVFDYNKPTADRKKVAKKDESFVTKSYVEGVAGELVKKPTADASTVVLDTENGCVLEVGTRNDDVGGVLKVGQMSGGVIEVGSAKEVAAQASIKKNGKEVATESQLPYSRNSEAALIDRAFNALSFDGTEYNLTNALAAVTPTVEGAPRDLLIVATASAATTVSYTAGTIKGDKPTIDGEGKWLITLTEYEPSTWYCRQIKMEDAQ